MGVSKERLNKKDIEKPEEFFEIAIEIWSKWDLKRRVPFSLLFSACDV